MTVKYKQTAEKTRTRVKDSAGVYVVKTSTQVVEAVFDGNVFRPTSPFFLKPNTKVRITIEIVKKKRGKSRSFLDVARSAKLKGPRDFSENLDDYLYRGKPFDEG